MSDDRVATRVRTRDGLLDFQHYFVERRCAPEATGFVFEGVERAVPQPAVLAALRGPGLRAIVICPSNPYISIDPILALPGMREALKSSPAPVIAVSPIIAGRAVKGPTAKMMRELKVPVDAGAVAAHYGDILDGYVIDGADAAFADTLDLPVAVAPTLMRNLADREALARAVLDFADALGAVPAKRAGGGRR
jgi:LPPG:FO 2-phospho-L-lactate transferase